MSDGQEGNSLPLTAAFLFTRQLQWRLELYLDAEHVVIQLVHTSHKKGGGWLGDKLHPPAEQFTAPEPSTYTLLRRSLFTDETQIREWFASVCDAFDANLHGILTFEILHHFADLTRFTLDHEGILKADRNEIVNDHIEGRAGQPQDIGTRQFETARSGFQMKEVSADKGYDSFKNRRLVLLKGGIPYIPFRTLNKPEGKGALWLRMYHFFRYHSEEFVSYYHKRSNVESTFSMIKRKFGEGLRSRTETAQANEALLKVLCHNICCLVGAMYELGVEPDFVVKPAP